MDIQAWSKHKRLCKIYQRQARGEPVPSPDSYCGLCGKENGPLRRTECCNRTVCDDYENYVRVPLFPSSYPANAIISSRRCLRSAPTAAPETTIATRAVATISTKVTPAATLCSAASAPLATTCVSCLSARPKSVNLTLPTGGEGSVVHDEQLQLPGRYFKGQTSTLRAKALHRVR